MCKTRTVLALSVCSMGALLPNAMAQIAPVTPGAPIMAGAGRPSLPGTAALPDPKEPLLPDVTVDARSLGDHVLTRDCDGEPDIQLCLRVSVATANIGQGALIVTAPTSHKDQVSQHITLRGGGEMLETVASAFVDDPAHQHIHLADWTELRLRKIDASCNSADTAGQCPIVGRGHKLSFCLEDSGPYNVRFGQRGGDIICGVDQAGTRVIQGISAGWEDLYERTLPGQLIDFTRLDSGEYWIEVEVNPGRAVHEANYDNNVTRVRARIQKPVCGDRRVSSAEECDWSTGRTSVACSSLGRGYIGGQATCDSTCALDVSACMAGVCPQSTLGSVIGPSVAKGPAPTGPDAFAVEPCGYPAGTTGSEVTFGWTAPHAGMFGFDTSGSTYDTLLYLRAASCKPLPNIRGTCDDGSGTKSGGGKVGVSSVSLRMQQGEGVVIVIDSFYSPPAFGVRGPTGAGAQFVLNISERPEAAGAVAPAPDAGVASDGTATVAGAAGTAGSAGAMPGVLEPGASPDSSVPASPPAAAGTSAPPLAAGPVPAPASPANAPLVMDPMPSATVVTGVAPRIAPGGARAARGCSAGSTEGGTEPALATIASLCLLALSRARVRRIVE